MSTQIKRLKRRLDIIEEQLGKVRGCSPITHGWQTQKLAKAQRNWDYWSAEKRAVISQLVELCNGECESCKDSLTCNIFQWK